MAISQMFIPCGNEIPKKTEINQLRVFTESVFTLFMEKNHLNNLTFNCDTLDNIIQPTALDHLTVFILLFSF